MRSRTTRVLLAVLACASPALAQELHRVGSTIAHLSYDLRTGELGLAASLSPGVAQPVYDNTCDGFYYARLRSAAETGGQKEEAIIDWGLLPSSAFPGNSLCTSGCADTYSIDELTIAYCTIADGLVDVVLSFWAPSDTCVNPFVSGAPLLGRLTALGLPGGGSAGSPACYSVDISGIEGLSVPGGSAIANPRFAIGFEMPGSNGTAGPIIAGRTEIFTCDFCDGTLWDADAPGPAAGTGFGQRDQVYFEQFGGPLTGCQILCCHYQGLSLELRSSTACTGVVPFCFGNAWDCPCGNAGQPGHGCENAALTGGVALGAGAFNPDGAGGGTATLAGAGFPTAASPAVVAIRAPQPEVPPVVFGDGLRCVGLAGLVRVGSALAQAGSGRAPARARRGHGHLLLPALVPQQSRLLLQRRGLQPVQRLAARLVSRPSGGIGVA